MKTSIRFLPVVALLGVLAAPAGARAGELEDAMERFQIHELVYRYGLVHDLTDPEAYAALFTTDGELVSGGRVLVKGREALMQMTRNDRDKYNPGAADGKRSFMLMRHIITNPVVTLNPDGTASGICFVQVVVQRPGGGPVILSQGRYEDQFRKEDGKWRISRREIFAADMHDPALGKELGIGR